MIYQDIGKIIELDLAAYLQSDPFIAGRNVLAFEPGDVSAVVQQKVTKAIGAGNDGKVGLGLVTLPVEIVEWPDREVAFGPFKFPIQVDIFENVSLNTGPRGTNYSLRQWAFYVAKILSCNSAANLTTDWVADQKVIEFYTPIINGKPDETLRGARVNFHTYESDPVQFQQAGSPFLTPSAPVSLTPGANNYPMSVAIAAPGATVWYTIDGSNPWAGLPANADTNFAGIRTSAVQWDGRPVAITQPCFFRARAFIPGQIGSKTSSIYFA